MLLARSEYRYLRQRVLFSEINALGLWTALTHGRDNSAWLLILRLTCGRSGQAGEILAFHVLA